MANYESTLLEQRNFFSEGLTKDVAFRINSLKRLQSWIRDHETEILTALKQDLNKSPFEAYATEIGVVLDEIKYALKNIKKWSSDKRVRTSIKNFPAKCFIQSDPYGVVLIISPWNYPFMLAIAPVIGAIAAGNCVIMKPSEYSPNTSALIAQMIKEVFDKSFVTVVLGCHKESESLLSNNFDYICFTGSTSVGKIVMGAASKHLTPVTLELGGKSPCIVDETANIKLAARRIVWGKLLNAGQTCVAPDYLLVHKNVKEALLQEMISCAKLYFGENPCDNAEYPRIINKRHFDRLLNLLQDERVIVGGGFNTESLQIAPTLLDSVSWESPIMQEEIFGPLLPILTFESLPQAVEQINSRPKPLALYFFTTNKLNEKTVLQNISFGGGCVNDTVMHLSIPWIPFGGVGDSGMGGYRGKFGFETFSHKKSVLKTSLLVDLPIRYPPYKGLYLNLLRKL